MPIVYQPDLTIYNSVYQHQCHSLTIAIYPFGDCIVFSSCSIAMKSRITALGLYEFQFQFYCIFRTFRKCTTKSMYSNRSVSIKIVWYILTQSYNVHKNDSNPSERNRNARKAFVKIYFPCNLQLLSIKRLHAGEKYSERNEECDQQKWQ